MTPITQLVGFGLRQVIGDYADGAVQVAAVIEQRFRDHSRTLPKALDQAHHRAWQALGVALAGDGLLDRVKVFFASGDDKGVREQVQLFLDGNAVSFDGTPADFRQDCLDELKRLRKSGRLSTPEGAHAAIARQAAGFQRHADPQGLVEEARRAVNGVADALAENYPNLTRLLRTPTPVGPPLLAAAFCYFFRREVETNDELAHGLFFDGLRQLSASQAKAFGEVGKALASLGGQFDALFEQLGRIEAAVEETHTVAVETHGAVLDMQTELQRFGGEARTLMEQVLLRLGQVGMARGEVRPGNSCSIRGEDERRAVKALLARFRELPAEEQRQAPALLNGLGKLQVGAGDFTEARQLFTEVVQVVGNPTDKAEASFNAYRAALEEKKWDAALSALREAGSHDPQRFAPFPLHRYEPKRILGAGGFGAGVLCRDRHFDENVVVKTLYATDLASSADEVFREARILRRLSHPVIIVVRDCEYADLTHKARPYLVMDYFPGTSLQEFVEQRGPLNLEQLLAVAVQMAEGMIAAHAKGVLHRDLKPANLLVRKEGNLWKVKIIDFGLALRQQTVETSRLRTGADQKSILDSSVAGTLDYAPPEQLGKLPGVQPGPYSDVYAFARTCCYAMFKTTELRRKQWDSLPKPLADLLEGCLDPDPQQRPKGFEPVLAVLDECSRAGQETRRREQEERLRREQEEELGRQKEGEEQLRELVRAALNRTGGKPTGEDTAMAKALCRRHKLTADRANAIIREVKDFWQREREKREHKPTRQEAAHQLGAPVERAMSTPPSAPLPPWALPVESPLVKLRRKSGELYTNSIGMRFSWIPAGSFAMGSPLDEEGRGRDEILHDVTLTNGFYLGVHPVTQGQWRDLMGGHESPFHGRDLPIENVSWDDAVDFCKKLTAKEGETYRLPTEAEWEYACRAGTVTRFHFGDTLSPNNANFDDAGGKGRQGLYRQETSPVDKFAPNPWGLQDMHGNVWEWCQDWYGPYPPSSWSLNATDPQRCQVGECRVTRGGSWDSLVRCCRSACRNGSIPTERGDDIGFRVCLCQG